jgi:hypothetical protein
VLDIHTHHRTRGESWRAVGRPRDTES